MTEPTFPTKIIRNMPAGRRPPTGRDAKASPVPPEKVRRLNLNESPHPPSPVAVKAMQDAAANVNRYPDPSWHNLASAIADRVGVPVEHVILGNGSDELIVNAGRISLEPGDEMVVPVPSFPGYYKCGAVNGAEMVMVQIRDDASCDVDGIIAAITDKTRLVICATPNNPTGGMLPTAEIEKLVAAVPESAFLLLDEAYYEFAIHAGGDDHLATMQKHKGPWAIFRTFSKAYGLAGIRVGYCIAGSDEVADAFQNVRSVFNVNVVAQAGALAAMSDMDHVKMILDATKTERDRISAGLTELGCAPFPSVGNFIAAKCDRPAADIVADLQGHGILISSLMGAGYENYIRITIGDADDTDALLAALKEVL